MRGGIIKEKPIFMAFLLFLGVLLLSTSFVTAVNTPTELQGQKTTLNSVDPTTSTDQQATCSTQNTDPQTTSSTPNDNNQNQLADSSAPQAAGATSDLPPINQNGVVKSYWLWGSTLSSNPGIVTTLQSQQITDVFVLIKGTSGTLGDINVVLSKFRGTGIRVHAWMICFKDASYSASWIDPSNQQYQNYLIDLAKNLAGTAGLAGIHLDYVRYSGVASANHAAYQHDGTTVITTFVQVVHDAVKKINPDIYLSAAVMPETTQNAYLYGQDYRQLSQYLEFLVPMVYEGNYQTNDAWIASTTNYIVQHAINPITGLPIPVIVGLQNYHGDSNTEILSADELNADISSAMTNGAAGYAIFRATTPIWSTYTVAIPYKKVRYRAKIKKVYKVKTRRGYRYRVRYVRFWTYKWLYTYKTYGHVIMGA